MKAPWWTGVAMTEAEISCGPERHRLQWQAGQLLAVDHPDPDAERVLAELGGTEPACLALLREWDHHADDPRVLSLGSRHPGDQVHLAPEDLETVRHPDGERPPAPRYSARPESAPRPDSAARPESAVRPESAARPDPSSTHGATSTSPPPGTDDVETDLGLLQLLALAPGLQRRLQQSVAAHLSGAWSTADPRDVQKPPAASDGAALAAATVSRIRPLLERWLETPARSEVTLGPQAGISFDGTTVRVIVQPTWLAEVWGRYLGLVDGFLILSVNRIVSDRAEVTGMSSPSAEVALLTVTGPAPWRVIARSPLEPGDEGIS